MTFSSYTLYRVHYCSQLPIIHSIGKVPNRTFLQMLSSLALNVAFPRLNSSALSMALAHSPYKYRVHSWDSRAAGLQVNWGKK